MDWLASSLTGFSLFQYVFILEPFLVEIRRCNGCCKWVCLVSRPGQSQGLLYKHHHKSFIHSFVVKSPSSNPCFHPLNVLLFVKNKASIAPIVCVHTIVLYYTLLSVKYSRWNPLGSGSRVLYWDSN